MGTKVLLRRLLLLLSVVMILFALLTPRLDRWFYAAALIGIGISLVMTGIDTVRHDKKAFGFMLLLAAGCAVLAAVYLIAGPSLAPILPA